MKILPGTYLWAKKSTLNFGSRPDQDPDRRIFEGIFSTVGYGEIQHLLLIAQVIAIIQKFFEGRDI